MNKHILYCIFFSLACLLVAAVFLSGSYGPAQASSLRRSSSGEPVWGPDIQVNPTAEATPSVQRNYSMAINPPSPNLILAAYDSLGFHNSQNSYAWGTDAGRT